MLFDLYAYVKSNDDVRLFVLQVSMTTHIEHVFAMTGPEAFWRCVNHDSNVPVSYVCFVERR